MTILILITCHEGFSQDVFHIPRLSSDPVLDGNLFEPTWDQIEARELIMCNPTSGVAASQRSEFKIGYTDQYLYYAAYNYDTDPNLIMSSSKKRDEMELNNEWSGISLDTYNDNENALCFATTPAALRLDMQILNDGEGGFPVNRDWNVIWEVNTVINDQGWFAEFRIPLSALRYQVVDDTVTMGLATFRYLCRKSEWDVYPAIPNTWGFWSFAKVSRFQDAEMTGVKSINPLYFSPYVLAGYQQAFKMNATSSRYDKDVTWNRNIGMDIKYGLAKNLTLDLTINTDFAQVEADDQVINLTRFSIYFPEKRQFFMERSNVFDFTFGMGSELFYSRTIGLHEGYQVPLWGGGRLTGRAGKWDLGFMSLQTGFLEVDSTRILETTNHTVIRTRRQLPLNKNSYVGFMGTSKYGLDGNYNISYGLDAILNLKGDTYLKMALAQTVDSEYDNNMVSLDPLRFLISLDRRNFEGFSYNLNVERAGKNYNPEMGFETRTDFSKIGQTLSYGIIAPENSYVARHSFDFDGYEFFRNSDGSLETLYQVFSYDMTSKESTELTLQVPFHYDDVRNSFSISDEISIDSGKYRNIAAKVSYSTCWEKPYYATFGIYSGRYYEGWRNSFSFSPLLNIGNTWRFSINYSYNRINFRNMGQIYQSHLLRFKTWYMLSVKLSAMGYIQYNSLTQGIFINAKIRYNPREGNDLYIVYNDGINTGRYDFDPVLPFSSTRTILIKYTHTFRVR